MFIDELCSKVRWLEAERATDQWKLEALMVPRVHEVVDLTCEEDEGGVGGPIVLVDETPAPESVVPPLECWTLDSDDERVLVGLLVGITSEKEWRTEGEYTPTGPYGLDFDL